MIIMEILGGKDHFFWNTMDKCLLDFFCVDDEKLLAPVIDHLSKQSDSLIFRFDNEMHTVLEKLCTEEIMENFTENSDEDVYYHDF